MRFDAARQGTARCGDPRRPATGRQFCGSRRNTGWSRWACRSIPRTSIREDQLNRRHGYADMLRYPQRYKMHWRLWNGGTARVLLWGDPDYARRFVESTHLYDGDGFEVNEPLCTKMEAQPHDAKPFDLLNPHIPLLRLRVRAVLAFLPGLRPHRLQPEHARGGLGSGIRTAIRARTPARPSRRRCTTPAGFCRGSSRPAIPTATFP